MPSAKTGAELLFEILSQRYERGSTMLTSNLPFAEWTEVLGLERREGRDVEGGAATILHLPLDPAKALSALTLEVSPYPIVAVLLGVTLVGRA